MVTCVSLAGQAAFAGEGALCFLADSHRARHSVACHLPRGPERRLRLGGLLGPGVLTAVLGGLNLLLGVDLLYVGQVGTCVRVCLPRMNP